MPLEENVKFLESNPFTLEMRKQPQESEGICLRSHSQLLAELETEHRAPGCRGLFTSSLKLFLFVSYKT